MQGYKDNYTLRDENSIFWLTVSSVIGDREDQQDSAGYEIKHDEGIVVVCDGMGGHSGGKTASTIAVETILRNYLSNYPCEMPYSMIQASLIEADKKISELKNQIGELLHAGSTAVTVFLKGNQMHWASVGDSRIYIYRKGFLVKATIDHNLKSLLERQYQMRQISQIEYDRQICQGDVLVSFLGNGMPFIEANEKALQVMPNDRIFLVTDGLYKQLTDEELANVISNFENPDDALFAIEKKVQRKSKNVLRDNMTVAIIKIK